MTEDNLENCSEQLTAEYVKSLVSILGTISVPQNTMATTVLAADSMTHVHKVITFAPQMHQLIRMLSSIGHAHTQSALVECRQRELLQMELRAE